MTDKDLFGSEELVPRKSKKTKTVKPPPPSFRAEYAFKAEFEETHPGVPLLWKDGRDRKILIELIKQVGNEDLVIGWLIPEFFRCQDPSITRFIQNYDVRDLAFVAQRLLLKRGGRKTLHPRTAENVYEVRKAMGKERNNHEENH